MTPPRQPSDLEVSTYHWLHCWRIENCLLSQSKTIFITDLSNLMLVQSLEFFLVFFYGVMIKIPYGVDNLH